MLVFVLKVRNFELDLTAYLFFFIYYCSFHRTALIIGMVLIGDLFLFFSALISEGVRIQSITRYVICYLICYLFIN